MATAGTEQGKELMRDARDHELGMNRRITRRDFLNGVAIGVGSLTASAYLTGCSKELWSGDSDLRKSPNAKSVGNQKLLDSLRHKHPSRHQADLNGCR